MYKKYISELKRQSGKNKTGLLKDKSRDKCPGCGRRRRSEDRNLHGNCTSKAGGATTGQSGICSSNQLIPRTVTSDAAKTTSSTINISSTTKATSSRCEVQRQVSFKDVLLRTLSNASKWSDKHADDKRAQQQNDINTSVVGDIRCGTTTHTLAPHTVSSEKYDNHLSVEHGTIVGRCIGGVKASDADIEEGHFLLYFRKNVHRFFVYGFKSGITIQQLTEYIQRRGPTVTWVTIFPTRNNTFVTIRLNVKTDNFSCRLTLDGFWPRAVTCRPWRSRNFYRNNLHRGYRNCSGERYGGNYRLTAVDINDYINY